MKPAMLYKTLNNKQVQCLACNWYCKLNPDQVGICGTRLNRNGKLYSLVYGKTTGLALDPVEKKPLYHFLPNSTFLSFGTFGCNFACAFCQNWEISQSLKTTNLKLENRNLVKMIDGMSQAISPRQIINRALAENTKGIAYTYNEPVIFAEFAHDTMVLAKKKGLKNIFVSNGFISKESFNLVKDYLDGINIDLKSFCSKFYQQICHARLKPVKENIKRFFNSGIHTEVTTLLIPDKNDSAKELKAIAKFLYSISPDLIWHITVFHPSYQMLNLPPTDQKTLTKAYEIGKKSGLKYVYVGNIIDSQKSSTYCPNCQTMLIWRCGWQVVLKQFDPQTRKCKICGEIIYGVWQ